MKNKKWKDIDYFPTDNKNLMKEAIMTLLDQAGLKVQKNTTEHLAEGRFEYTLDHFRIVHKNAVSYMKSKKKKS